MPARADARLSFCELALESVLSRDSAAATAYALDELGELAADTVRAERMRETLYVWLRSGSRTVTAARPGVHENTVRMRPASVAETLGPDHLERRTELLVALRLCRAPGASGLRRPA
ncbi:helix-turn-helix domain-containing protein [Streptomyces fagopyri]|uniref:helix-turn-helix domain-containing protein n=1 Tax=Streptomyces fagopyri TaxID=2662397 RepID=UPI0036ABC4DE